MRSRSAAEVLGTAQVYSLLIVFGAHCRYVKTKPGMDNKIIIKSQRVRDSTIGLGGCTKCRYIKAKHGMDDRIKQKPKTKKQISNKQRQQQQQKTRRASSVKGENSKY